MPWLFLLLGLVAMAVAMKTTSMLLMVICLLASLVFLVLWAYGWYASRVVSVSRDESLMLDPDELRRLREQAEARKLAAQVSQEPPST
ncbi:hypothetical protein IP90_03100 [Luteimonas cucumeris]|uniref:Uncharacterized protein n=1 Tax=Luteimonas cucumeris TaxID=985012 RepID=A0A562KW24_9GAMM|nr:hypothetical protein [Luteimonas cucumeris]TWH99485.1 hypothetical protein IP90_03100 [Luteimonas cucumeris]